MDPKPFSPSGIHNICYCKRNTSIHLLQPIFLVIYKKIKCWADVKGQENMNDSIPACLSWVLSIRVHSAASGGRKVYDFGSILINTIWALLLLSSFDCFV